MTKGSKPRIAKYIKPILKTVCTSIAIVSCMLAAADRLTQERFLALQV